MKLQEFKKDFIEEIKVDAKATGEGTNAAFVAKTAQYLEEAGVLSDFTTSFFTGTGKRNRKLRIDGYAYDEFDKTMSLVIADFKPSEVPRVLVKTQAKQFQEKLIHFIDESLNTPFSRSLEVSRPCSDLVDLLLEKRKEVRKYQLLIFTTASISKTIVQLNSPDIDGVPSECQIWDIQRLFNVCVSGAEAQAIEINFKEYSSCGIPCLEASSAATEDFNSYLCIIPGSALADIYDKYGSKLLEGNVRSFLSTKVAVNKKIRTTILQYPERFFAYNNGISATAMDVMIDGQFLVSAKEFQIINGGQTTASLSNARFRDKADLRSIFVQMKLTVIEKHNDAETTELVQNISRSSNSQNKVTDADFFSTHPFHVRMEQFSRRLYARATGGSQHETKWFYERARGQYVQMQMRLTPGEKKKFLLQYPKNQLITKTDLAKVRNTWRGLPHFVSRGAQTNFTEFAKYTDLAWKESNGGVNFCERYFQETVGLIILFKYTETMVGQQEWYSSGYRANIVTYTIALLRKLIQKQFTELDLNLMKIWERQGVPEPVQTILTKLSKIVYEKLTDKGRGVENVTQWCKREECWKSVLQIEYHLPNGVKDYLIGKEAQKVAEKKAKAEQRALLASEAQKKVCEDVTPTQWINALKFVENRQQLLSPHEYAVMQKVRHFPAIIPTPTQCKKLLRILERLQEEGFRL